MKKRLDQYLVDNNFFSTRSQAENHIRIGNVKVNAQIEKKPGKIILTSDKIEIVNQDIYVSRAGHKLASVVNDFGVIFNNKIVLDVGSSTGGFTDFALQNGASKVYAVDVGTNQLHPVLRSNKKIELSEQTDIRNVSKLPNLPDVVLIDVSFISQREILPHIKTIIGKKTTILAMVKPQFESQNSGIKHKGVIKNESYRREILKNFEEWVKKYFVIINKKDSAISGQKGNQERFYQLIKL